MIQTGFHVSRPTQDTSRRSLYFAYRTFTYYGSDFHQIQLYIDFLLLYRSPTTPIPKDRFGLFPLRSPLLRESIFLSFPLVTKMFQFARLLSLTLCIHVRITVSYYCWVPPFGNLRIKAYVQLPEAYRRSSRPSSASSAKASAMRPY